MARPKSDVNKSDEIRNVLNANPTASVKDVIAELSKKNINVQPSLVYFIKAKDKKAKKRQKRDQAVQVVSGTNSNTLDVLRRLKGLASEVGGLGKLKQLVDLLLE